MPEIHVKTNRRMELIDITDMINSIIAKSEVGDGIALIFTKHTTVALIVNENEAGLISDIEASLKRLIPKLDYKHDRIDNNADSHLRSILLQSSIVLPIKSSHLDLGTWQRVILIELDGPRERTVTIKLLSENKGI
ncbi:MAG: YjbQ family protein [Candidatus Altiarchaeales archaeon]|nr:MAG: YjbQ family protein [Candidatus Altiarchaeales archaeon]